MHYIADFVRRMFYTIVGDHGIGKTLLIWILFFSSMITVILSGVQLLIDYQVEVSTINKRFSEIESSYKNSLEASLWNVDREQLNIQLEGIKRLPDIQYVAVIEKQEVGSAISVEKGAPEESSIRKQYPLQRQDGGATIAIGTFTVEASLAGVYQRLINKAVTILLVQGIKTFFVSFFILFVFYRLVTRHIINIQGYLNSIQLGQPVKPMYLDRRQKTSQDELDQLVTAYNAMAANLTQAYEDIQVVNKRLRQDIAARKQAEAEVSELNAELESRVTIRTAELEAANKELNAFCYSVSHDLRAPLRRVDGFRRNLASECSHKLDQRGVHYLSRLEACVREMTEMIDSFLTLSKSTSTELHIEKINLSVLVRRSLEALTERDTERKVTLNIQKGIQAKCDAKLVALLVNNLIDNAWKYTSKKDDAEISFYLEKQGSERVYVIADNGAGFNMEFAKHLFAPFARLHKVSDFQGVGIGLATVKRVAARHGGRVWVESEVDKGARFYFTLEAKDIR